MNEIFSWGFLIFFCFTPILCLLLLIKERKIWRYSLILVLITLALIAYDFYCANRATDFHGSAFILQIFMPLQLISALIAFVVGNIILLSKNGFFTHKRLRAIGLLLAFIVVAGIVTKIALVIHRNISLSKYPDIEFSDTYYLNTGLNDSVYGYWDSSSNSYKKVTGDAFNSVLTEEKYNDINYIDALTSEQVTPFCTAYNKDKTTVYYSSDNKIYRYNTKTNQYDFVVEFLTDNIKGWSVRKIVVSEDENILYAITGNTKDTDEYNCMYSIDVASKDIKKILSEDGWINDMELSPDGSSLIYYGGYKIRKYDIASGERSILLEDACPKTKGVPGEGIIRISDDGRFIMYYCGLDHSFLKA